MCMTLSKKKYFKNLYYVHNLQNYRTNEVQQEAVTKCCSRGKVFLKIAVCPNSCLLKKELFYKNFSLIYSSNYFIEHLAVATSMGRFFAQKCPKELLQ